MWDAIVVGSGIGGLAAAAALAKRSKRVLLLEQHTVPGGQTQTFRRQGWVFATGVHYVSGVGPQEGPEGQFRRLLEWLGDGSLRFAPCVNPYDIVHLPGFEFGIPHPEAAYRAALHGRFPGEGAAIDDWFHACHEARKAGMALMASHDLPAWIAWGFRLLRGRQADRWSRHTLADQLADIADPRLHAVLGARWADYGAPPTTAPFIEHALVTGAYDGGAYYPVGGPARFAESLLPTVRAAGGECRLGAEVRQILVENERAVGVEVVEGGSRAIERAEHVISDIGLANTLARLDALVAPAWREQASRLAPGLGYVALYIGFEGDISGAGATSANHWIYDSEDIDRVWRQPADEDAPGLFISFPSLKDPAWKGSPTAEVLAVVDRAAFATWLDEPQLSNDYAAFKDWVTQRLLGQFNRHFPTLAPMVRFYEAATPLTQRRFVRAVGGSMYGVEMSVERQSSDALRLRTPVPGLLLAGQDVTGPGVQAAFMGGLMAAATVEPALWRQLGR
ncbi:phytoene desaturase family protein [Azohydromonas australica]|uniref:phytoene desaturase family protein n=1 Tax=Azohydromonas australica TaxID=364039 RepID=UPI00040902A5|nr:NAD(P)/FAD-dependent oxidoreductase [Azohydromonas australica]